MMCHFNDVEPGLNEVAGGNKIFNSIEARFDLLSYECEEDEQWFGFETETVRRRVPARVAAEPDLPSCPDSTPVRAGRNAAEHEPSCPDSTA